MNAPEPRLHEVYARNEIARRVVVGWMSALPVASEMWQQVDRALADVPVLGAAITRLTAELSQTRLDRANLLAAMRATIAANADGEPDPLYYVRDELQARQELSQDHGEAL